MMKANKNTVVNLLSLVKGDMGEVIEDLISNILVENSAFISWASHPEYIQAYGRMRKISKGLMISGEVSYHNQSQKIRIIIREDGEMLVRESAIR